MVDGTEAGLLLARSDAALDDAAASRKLLPELHAAANAARAEARHDEAVLLFHAILRHHTTDQNVRVALAEYAARDQAHDKVHDLLAPVLPTLLASAIYAPALAMLAEAKLRLGLLGDIADLVASLPTQQANHDIKFRLALFQELGISHAASVETSSPVDRLLEGCLTSRDEYSLLLNLRGAAAMLPAQAGPTQSRLLVAIAAICHQRRWHRPYRAAVAMLVGAYPESAETRALWKRAGLPPVTLEAVPRGSSGDAAPHLHAARAAFRDEPEPATAAALWSAALDAGEHAQVLRFGTALTTGGAGPSAATLATLASRAQVRSDEAPRARIWYMITWHEEVDRLLRLVSMLAAPHVTIVVSIGGAVVPGEILPLTAALAQRGVYLLFRPVVTWGGQRLLYHNSFTVMRAFLDRAEADWLQVICNRSFPLMGPDEAGSVLADPAFIRNHPGVPGPPAWTGEWPADTVADLDTIYGRAVHDIYERVDPSGFLQLADAEYKLNSSVFNFSDQAEVLESNFKDEKHGYYVSPFGTDMRWMSFSRLGEFVDVSTETGRTYSRRAHPLLARWMRIVLNRNQPRTGDPFVLMDRRYAEVALNDPRATELFAAMNMGFAPEMNFFDTLHMTEHFDLADHMTHTYHRNEVQEARASDIASASLAADAERCMFMRKTWPSCSGPFVENFAEKIAAEWPADQTFACLRNGRFDRRGNPMPDLLALLADQIAGRRVALRNMLGGSLGEATFAADGALLIGGRPSGRWCWQDHDLQVTFDSHGTKLYRRATSDGEFLTLVPNELVSVRNGWGVFIDLDLASLCAPETDDNVLAIDFGGMGEQRDEPWLVGSSAAAALLESFVAVDHPDYRMPVARLQGRVIETRTDGATTLCLCEVDGWPALLELVELGWFGGRGSALLRRCASLDPDSWASMPSGGELVAQLRTGDLVGRYSLDTLAYRAVLEFAADGQVLNEAGIAVGVWRCSRHTVWIIGPPALRFAKATQFQRRADGRWRVSGWSWADLEERITFSLNPEPDAATVAAHTKR